jgi:type 2A phosphatase activator TIP41
VHLFEDELHDNGISQLSIKIRVMPTCYYILMRQWLRVDNVLLRIIDTRFYHHFDTNYITRERSIHEETFENIFAMGHSRVLSSYSDPNVFQPLLKKMEFKNERLVILSSN